MDLTVGIFILVYIAMGLGKLPGFKVDRTGAAVIGAMALVAAGSITLPDAWHAIDYDTLCLLFGLMVVSAAFIESGFYHWTARQVAGLHISEPTLLAVLVLVGGVLSALLSNAVVMVAMTPLLVAMTLDRGLNPVPFLLGFCFASNTGAVGTLIGSPKNMIVAQALDISFNDLLHATLVPALLSLPVVWGLIVWMYRGRWRLTAKHTLRHPREDNASCQVDHWETIKAGVVTLAVIVAFVAGPWPREMVALSAAGLLLMNRQISSRDMLKHVDGNLLLLIMGLFVVNAAFAATGLPEHLLDALQHAGLSLNSPMTLFLVVSLVCILVGTTPSVMLLLPFLPAHPSDPTPLASALIMGTSFSSNIFVFGSLAGIIVVEQAAVAGVKIRFGEFVRAGLPITVVCMLMAAVTLWLHQA